MGRRCAGVERFRREMEELLDKRAHIQKEIDKMLLSQNCRSCSCKGKGCPSAPLDTQHKRQFLSDHDSIQSFSIMVDEVKKQEKNEINTLQKNQEKKGQKTQGRDVQVKEEDAGYTGQVGSTLVIEGYSNPAAVEREMAKIRRGRQEMLPKVYQETIRGKKRAGLQGYTCHLCEQFVKDEAGSSKKPYKRREELMKHCRHRAIKPPPQTPPNYWTLSFSSTRTQPPPGYSGDPIKKN